MTAAEVRERYLRVCDEAGADVTVVAATKYVSLDELGLLAQAGVEVVGENRAQDLAAKQIKTNLRKRVSFAQAIYRHQQRAALALTLCEKLFDLAPHHIADGSFACYLAPRPG